MSRLTITIHSFGFKHGKPTFERPTQVFDCRDLSNPHSNRGLRPMTGKDKAVQDYVFRGTRAEALAKNAIKAAQAGNDLAFGCIGGRHRSVSLAEVVAQRLQQQGHEVHVAHHAL